LRADFAGFIGGHSLLEFREQLTLFLSDMSCQQRGEPIERR
jgi:hypothetical protein